MKLAIDSGQTEIKTKVSESALTSFAGIRTNEPLLPQLANTIAATIQRFGEVQEVAIGTTGLTTIEDDPTALLGIVAPLGVKRILLTHDSVTSYLGALGYQRGVVIAAGTGTVALGVGKTSVSRVDGWGNLLGDAGSGYWMGRLGLEQVMRAHDGRGSQTALTELVANAFPHLEAAYIELQTDPDRVRRIAEFAVHISELAATDEVCADICEKAGTELAISVLAAAQNVGSYETPPRVSLLGGVFLGEHIRSACIAKLRQRWPDLVPYPPQGDGLDGTWALFDLPESHPLTAMVHVAQ